MNSCMNLSSEWRRKRNFYKSRKSAETNLQAQSSHKYTALKHNAGPENANLLLELLSSSVLVRKRKIPYINYKTVYV